MIYRVPEARPDLAFVDATSWVWDDTMGYRRDTPGLSELYPVTLAPGFDLSLTRKVSCVVSLYDEMPGFSMGSTCLVAALSTAQTMRLGAVDWWAASSEFIRYYGLTVERMVGDLADHAFSFEIPAGVTVTALYIQSGTHHTYPPATRGIKSILLHTDSAKSLSCQVRDLVSLAAPRVRVRIFNWDLPQQFTEAAVAQDGTWSESDALPWGERYGVYYLSRDNRCPPIIHGPYTAE